MKKVKMRIAQWKAGLYSTRKELVEQNFVQGAQIKPIILKQSTMNDCESDDGEGDEVSTKTLSIPIFKLIMQEHSNISEYIAVSRDNFDKNELCDNLLEFLRF